MFNMMPAEDIALVQIAIKLCHNPELKREILCAPGSKYDTAILRKESLRIGVWYQIVENVAKSLVRRLGLSRHLQENLLNVLLLIARGMLDWAVYHENILGHSREQSRNALNSSHFTKRGLVDNKKAAEKLIKDKNLSIKQRYKLACLYCFTEHIFVLWCQMKNEEQEEFYCPQREPRLEQPELIKCWSYNLVGAVVALRGDTPTFQYMLEGAVNSGSRAGVEWCLEIANEGLNENSLLDAAIETALRMKSLRKHECFVFEEYRYEEDYSWIPINYLIDILCFLLSKMSNAHQIEFFKKDIAFYHPGSSVLTHFLDWPHQNQFMKTGNLMWEFLTEDSFSGLMELIFQYSRSKKRNYDYNNLFRDFWCNSPQHYKSYFIEKRLIYLILDDSYSFTNEKCLLILSDATNKEKEHMIYSNEGTEFCMNMLRAKHWKELDEFILNFFPSKEQAAKIKRELSIKETVISIFLDYVKNDEWHAVDSFIKWSSFNEVEINEFKKKVIYSGGGRKACIRLISHYESIKPVDKFIRWCFPLEENIKVYKKVLTFTPEVIKKCSVLIKKDKLELVDEFVKWSLSSEKDIREFKKAIACTQGPVICRYLISDFKKKYIYGEDSDISNRIVLTFDGCKWEQVEMFLTWVFSSEREIIHFKKGAFLEKEGTRIVYRLVRLNQWATAEEFFAWIGLTPLKIKQLKTKTIFNHRNTFHMFRTMVYTQHWNNNEEYGHTFQKYGSKQDGIELFLRWFLTDKKTVLEFKDKFKDVGNEYINETFLDIDEKIADFVLAIYQRLSDLDFEQRGTKRKFLSAEV